MVRVFLRLRNSLVSFSTLGCLVCMGFQSLKPSQGRTRPMRTFEMDWSEQTATAAAATMVTSVEEYASAAATSNPYVYNNMTASFQSSLAPPVALVPSARPAPARRRIRQSRVSSASQRQQQQLSRRDWFQRAATVAIGGAVAAGVAWEYDNNKNVQRAQVGVKKHLSPVNISQIAHETQVKISVESLTGCVSIDTNTFQKKQAVRLPSWFPASVVPPSRVVKDIPDSELLIAATFAGSTMEMARTLLLYPILTLKNRIQKEIKTQKPPATRNNMLHLSQRLKVMELNARRHFDEGKLYAGIVPSLLKLVPSTGVYYGTRDVMKRALHSSSLTNMLPFHSHLPHLSSVEISVIAALVADILSLMVKTPADSLATRLQVAAATATAATTTTTSSSSSQDDDLFNFEIESSDDEAHAEAVAAVLLQANKEEEAVGNWFAESLERLPAIILTDLPYLLSKVAINQSLLNGNSIDIGRYEVMAISTALLCAFITTPFDVARTRLLVEKDSNSNNKGGDSSSGGNGDATDSDGERLIIMNSMEGGRDDYSSGGDTVGSSKDEEGSLIRTFQTIIQEGDGGVRNLFAGWFERTLYLGIGRAWIEPFQIVGYALLRDLILLEWFD